MSECPLVSIIMTAYNEERYIADAVASCCRQTYPNIELCVADDGSDDETKAIIKSLQPQGSVVEIKKARTEHRGIASAFNEALSDATGEYIAILAADDLQEPDRIDRQYSILSETTVPSIVSCGMKLLLDGGKLLRTADGDVTRLSPQKYGSPMASIMAHSGVYSIVGGFDKSLKFVCDLDWSYRAEQHKIPWILLDEDLYIYRRHQGSVTHKYPIEIGKMGRLVRCRYGKGEHE